jgi:O-acetyl-ADP-ribose deacetylase
LPYDGGPRGRFDDQNFRFFVTRITVVWGDITTQDVDAIVNAANSRLVPGAGVAGAIAAAGGPEIYEESRRVLEERYSGGVPTGSAVATGAGNLPCRWVIHAVGPVYDSAPDASQLLASCYRESLRIAGELGAKTIAFPAVSTGVFGYPLEEAAQVALTTVRDTATALDEIRFVLFDERSFEIFERELGGWQGPPREA